MKLAHVHPEMVKEPHGVILILLIDNILLKIAFFITFLYMLIICYIKYPNDYFINDATKLCGLFLMTKHNKVGNSLNYWKNIEDLKNSLGKTGLGRGSHKILCCVEILET